MNSAGFSGSRDGMTDAQLAAVRAWLEEHKPSVLHHGAGPRRWKHQPSPSADEQAVLLARELGVKTVAHPGPASVPGGFPASDETWEPVAWLVRDWDIAHDVADDGGVLLAAPDVMPARFRSGTATTARYAVREGAAVVWFTPDGTVLGGAQ